MKHERRQRIKDLFATLPGETARRAVAATELLSDFRREAAVYLLPAVRTALENPPQEFSEKQIAVARLNRLLHGFGLGIRHPDMEDTCGVTAIRNRGVESGWVRLVQRRRDGRGTYPKSAPTDNMDLDDLELIEAPPELPGPRRPGRR